MPDKNDFSELLAEMLLRMDRQDGHIQQTNEILRTVVDVQNRMLQQMELMYTSQQEFNARQTEVNSALLHEVRTIKTDMRELKGIVSNDHEERLRRLEEFMRRAS